MQPAGNDGGAFLFPFPLKIPSHHPFYASFWFICRDREQAFEHLVSVRVFVGVSAASSMVSKEFVKYRSGVERDEVKKTVEKLGTMSLKKWLGKSQQVHN